VATLVSKTNGNFTTAATWAVADAISLLSTEVSNAASTTSFISSAAFTPGAITIDALGVKVISRSATPSGTFSVRLAIAGVAVAGTTVTVNVSDITQTVNGWHIFKFAVPVTLAAATAYTLQIQSSVANAVTLYKSATAGDWSRILRTTTTQAPAAADNILVAGELTGAGTSNTWTVTMDNTAATSWTGGLEISGKGTLDYSTAISTTFQLRMGSTMLLNGAGTLQMGTLASPIPASSKAQLEFVVASNVQFGLNCRGDYFLNTYGAVKTGRALLAADLAVAGTSLTTNVSTGWLSGDVIAVASTTQTTTQSESLTLSGNASGTTVPVSAASFAHSGTAGSQAEIVNITRNVNIFGQSTTLQTFINLGATGVVNINYTAFKFMGSAVTGSRGIDIATTTGSCAITGCALSNFEATSSFGFNLNAAANNNITISDCVSYRIQSAFINCVAHTNTGILIQNCWGITGLGAASSILQSTATAGTYNGIVAVSAGGAGIQIGSSTPTSSLVMSNFTAHSNGAAGLIITGVTCLSSDPLTITGVTAWRNVTRGIHIVGSSNIVIDTASLFGNVTGNIEFITNVSSSITLKGVTALGGLSPQAPSGIKFSVDCMDITIENSFFGFVIPHGTADIDFGTVKQTLSRVSFRNTQFNSTNTVANVLSLIGDSFVGSSKHQGAGTSHFAWTRVGTLRNDLVLFDPATPGSESLRYTFSNLNTFANAVTPLKRVIVPSGKSLKVTASVRTSTVGDGTAYLATTYPRLVVKANPAVGVNSTTVLATATAASSGAWEVISGTTGVATDNGVLEFYIEAVGPITGWMNIDSWKVEVV
jgi:hypothetical protein